jgi:hypothetical protein
MDTKIFDELQRAWALKRDAATLTVIKDYLMERVPDGVDAQKWLHQQLGEMNFRWKSLADLKDRLVRYERPEPLDLLAINEWRLARATRDVRSSHSVDGDDGFIRLQKGEVTIARASPVLSTGVTYLCFKLYRAQEADASAFEFIDGEIAQDASRVWEGKAPKVELKKFTANARLSEETLAFHAEIYVDGKRAGEVSNHGTGGPEEVHWIDRAAGKRVNAWLLSQVHVSNLDEEGQPISEGALVVPEAYEMNEDLFFGILAEEKMKEKEEKRIAAKRTKFAATARARGSAPFVARLSDRSELFFEMRGDAKQSASEWLATWAAKQKRKVAVVSVEEMP